MSLREQQAVVARLVTNGPFRERFFAASPDAHDEFGLTRAEYEALRGLDAHRVGVAGGGNVSKRFDVLHPAFPLTTAFLDTRVHDFRERYAARTLFAASIPAELDAFARFARDLPLSPDERAFLDSSTTIERAARDLPPARPNLTRLSDATRPRLTPAARVFTVPVDLATAFEALAEGLPLEPAPGACTLLAWNAGGRVRWERVDEAHAHALAACDGTRTIAQLREAHGEGVDASLARWLQAGVLTA